MGNDRSLFRHFGNKSRYNDILIVSVNLFNIILSEMASRDDENFIFISSKISSSPSILVANKKNVD